MNTKGMKNTTGSMGVCLAFLVPFAPAVGADAQAPADANRTLVLAELFTSEGCNSCPPADRILEVLSKEQPVDGVYVVAMSEHVTYWDHQGWKDPFGSQRFTERQNMYGDRLRLSGVYTPQLVIDGTVELIGSDTAKLQRALADAAAKPKPRLVVEAALTANGAVSGTVSGPGLEAGPDEGAELLWAVTEDNLVVDVKRGENAKRTLRHSGVVRTLVARKIDRETASAASAVIPLQPEWKREHLRLVAFVQSTKTKRVLSVGWTRLPG
jgi:hypothetical protein